MFQVESDHYFYKPEGTSTRRGVLVTHHVHAVSLVPSLVAHHRHVHMYMSPLGSSILCTSRRFERPCER
jgi:hypothetical protein